MAYYRPSIKVRPGADITHKSIWSKVQKLLPYFRKRWVVGDTYFWYLNYNGARIKRPHHEVVDKFTLRDEKLSATMGTAYMHPECLISLNMIYCVPVLTFDDIHDLFLELFEEKGEDMFWLFIQKFWFKDRKKSYHKLNILLKQFSKSVFIN